MHGTFDHSSNKLGSNWIELIKLLAADNTPLLQPPTAARTSVKSRAAAAAAAAATAIYTEGGVKSFFFKTKQSFLQDAIAAHVPSVGYRMLALGSYDCV